MDVAMGLKFLFIVFYTFVCIISGFLVGYGFSDKNSGRSL